MPNRDTDLTFIIEDESSLVALVFGVISRQDVPSGEEATFGLSSFITQGMPPVDDFSIEIPSITGFSLNADNTGSHGCVVIEDEIHIVDRSDDIVYIYGLDGTFLRTQSLPSGLNHPGGITYNPVDERIYIVDNSDDIIYVVDKAYVSQGTITLNSGNGGPEGLTFWDDLIWCVDRDRTIYPYAADGTYNASRSFTIDASHNLPRSIAYSAGRFWFSDVSPSETDVVAYTEDGNHDPDRDFTLSARIFGLGVYNNQFILSDTTNETIVLREILSGISISINDSTQVVTVDSDAAWADHDITALVTAHQDDFTDPTAEFVIRFEQSVPVWDSLSAVTWAVDNAITSIDLFESVSFADSIALQSGILPDGVTLTNGILEGTPTDPTDDVTLTFRATNDAGTADATLSITIDGVAPSWTPLSPVTWTEDAAITSINLNNSVSGNETPTIALQGSTLPSGVTLSNGVISGTPTNPNQDRTVTFRATNSAGTADTTLAITIDAAGFAPTISAIADMSADYNEAITAITVAVTGDPTPTVTVAGLPTGVTYSSGQITGTPTVVGVHEVTITATNSIGTDTETFDLTVSRELMFFIDQNTFTVVARGLDGNLLSGYNISLVTAGWNSGFGLSDGFYVINDTNNLAIFYNLDRTEDTSRDISLGSGQWFGGLGLSDGFYVINDTNNLAIFYNLDRTEDTSRDVSLGSGQWFGGLGLSDGFYVINDFNDTAKFYNLDGTEDTSRDIALGIGSWNGGLSLSDGFYIIDSSTDTAKFYNLDRTRNTSRDIDLGTGQWLGGFAITVIDSP